MREQLRALAKLSEIDASASDLDQELKDIPAHIEEMRADVKRLEMMLEREQRELEEAEQLGRAQSEQVSSSNEQLSRAKAKGAKARNAREVEAAEREMDAVRRSMRDREGENKRLDEVVDKARAQLEQHQKELADLRAGVQEDEAKAQARVEELQIERSKVLTGRDEITAQLGKALLRRYERIRDKKGSAVAEVVEGTCMGCRMQLPPQQFIELQRGEELQQCPTCHRMLFVRTVLED